MFCPEGISEHIIRLLQKSKTLPSRRGLYSSDWYRSVDSPVLGQAGSSLKLVLYGIREQHHALRPLFTAPVYPGVSHHLNLGKTVLREVGVWVQKA